MRQPTAAVFVLQFRVCGSFAFVGGSGEHIAFSTVEDVYRLRSNQLHALPPHWSLAFGAFATDFWWFLHGLSLGVQAGVPNSQPSAPRTGQLPMMVNIDCTDEASLLKIDHITKKI